MSDRTAKLLLVIIAVGIWVNVIVGLLIAGRVAVVTARVGALPGGVLNSIVR
jgi:hypothetical protein